MHSDRLKLGEMLESGVALKLISFFSSRAFSFDSYSLYLCKEEILLKE